MLSQVTHVALVIVEGLLGTGCVLAIAAIIAYGRFRARMKAQNHLVWP